MEKEINSGVWLLLILVFMLFLDTDTIVIELGDDEDV